MNAMCFAGADTAATVTGERRALPESIAWAADRDE